MFALGLHRDTKSSDQIPEFLLESRRRSFAAAFSIDKSIATFLGRPPRIPSRYSDCSLPLDVSDNAFMSDDGNLRYSLGELDAHGWNTSGNCYPTSWMRTRFIVCKFRDEILDVSVQKSTAEAAVTLR